MFITNNDQFIASASFWTSWLSWVCKSESFFLRMAIPIRTIFSGRRDPQDSTFTKNLFGLPSGSYGAWTMEKKKDEKNYQKFFCFCYVDLIPPIQNSLFTPGPLFRLRVQSVSQCIIWIILKSHPSSWIPFCMFLSKSWNKKSVNIRRKQ